MNRYRCVFIDWHNTLSTTLFWDHLAHGNAASRHTCMQLRTSLFEHHRDLINPWMRGAMSTESVMRLVAEDTGQSLDLVQSEFVAGCKQMTLVSPVIPSLVSALRAQGCLVIIATDNMDSFVRWTVPSLGLSDIFDGILCSSEIGGLKRDRDENGRSVFFGRMLETHGIQIEESLLLDDDVSAATTIQSFGIHVRHVSATFNLVAHLMGVLNDRSGSKPESFELRT